MRPAGPARVLVLAGGGLDPLAGGVGTLLRYAMDAFAADARAPRLRVVDTRGSGGVFSGLWRFVAAIGALCRAAGPGGADLVHAHMTTRGSAWRKSLACALASALGLPVILHMHGADFLSFYRAQLRPVRFALRQVLRSVDAVIVMGSAWRDFLVAELRVSPERVHVLPNGVPAAPVAAAPEAAPVILFLGRIGARKGVPELVEALASPRLLALPWRAVIAGDGDAGPFRSWIAERGIGDRVAMPGWLGRAAAARALAAADLLVLPSHHEVLPMAVLEALAAGVAVVATPVGALPDFLEDGVNARLVPPGDALALAGAIEALLRDPAARARLAASGQVTWRRHYRIEDWSRGLAALYASVGAAGRRVPRAASVTAT